MRRMDLIKMLPEDEQRAIAQLEATAIQVWLSKAMHVKARVYLARRYPDDPRSQNLRTLTRQALNDFLDKNLKNLKAVKGRT